MAGQASTDAGVGKRCAPGVLKRKAKKKIAVEKLQQPRKGRTKARRLVEAQAKADAEDEEDDEPLEPRGVIYLGHVPNGFFEPQMRKFFSQFGKVTRLRLSRSKKNAQSKGYAFIEFEEESVAKIVAETMNKYMLFEKTLVCHLLPPEKQHPALFKSSGKKMLNLSGLRRKLAREIHNDRPLVKVDGEQLPLTTLTQDKKQKRRARKLQAVLGELGVDYDTTDIAGGGSTKVQKKASGADSRVSRGGLFEVFESADAAKTRKTKKKRRLTTT